MRASTEELLVLLVWLGVSATARNFLRWPKFSTEHERVVNWFLPLLYRRS
jgi:hypothetical protein